MSIPERFENPCKSENLDKDCAVLELGAEPLDVNYCKDVVSNNKFGVSLYESMQEQAAILKQNVWDQGQTILISFMNGTTEQKTWVQSVVENAYTSLINLRLVFVSDDFKERSDVRIKFDTSNGSWSYLGRQCLEISQIEPTMNLSWLDLPPLSGGIILHEFGHCIGPFIHEHQNPKGNTIEWNVPVVISSLCGPPNNWSRKTICENMFSKYSQNQIRGSSYDSTSIMQYPYPATWTLNGQSSVTPQKLSDEDRYWLQFQYPVNSKLTTDNIGKPEVLSVNNMTASDWTNLLVTFFIFIMLLFTLIWLLKKNNS
jgi:serralysin